MSVYSVYLGCPEFSNVLRRERISRFVGTAGDRPVVVSAPSGCGKTVALADYANSQDLPVLWSSLGGQDVDYTSFLASVCSALSGNEEDRCREAQLHDDDVVAMYRRLMTEHCPAGAMVVLDDAGFTPAGAISFIERFTADHRHSPLRLNVSMRQGGVDDSRLHLVNASHLAFTDEEAQQVAALLGRNDLEPDKAVEISRACSGHPALTSTMMAALHESDHLGTPNPASALAEHIVADHLLAEERRLFGVLRIVRRVAVGELEAMGFRDAASTVRRLTACVPLVRVDSSAPGSAAVVSVHDLLCESTLEETALDGLCELGVEARGLFSAMARNAESDRLFRLASSPALHESAATWLEAVPRLARDALGSAGVRSMLESLPLDRVLRRGRLMQLWADVLLDAGQVDSALEKARIACQLAEQGDDAECLTLSAALAIHCLTALGRPVEAWKFGSDYLERRGLEGDARVRCELLASLAEAAAAAGSAADFESVRLLADECLGDESAQAMRPALRIKLAHAALVGASSGDWAAVTRLLSSVIQLAGDSDAPIREAAKSSLAGCLVEMGRILRARGLLDSASSSRHSADAINLPLIGMVYSAEGDFSTATRFAEQGVSVAVAAHHDVEAGRGRVALAMLRRAAGELSSALECAERAYEALSRLDIGGYRSLAALEVAAVLLAMKDVSAARHWVSLASIPDEAALRYHGLRSAMLLAECHRMDGEAAQAVDLLGQFVEEIRSENSNWQMANYIHSFPHLLGMLAAAAGPRQLPSHMLNLIPVDDAEKCLRLCRPMLADEDWRLLGDRLMGTERFTAFIERRGRPLCRVRLFGGLEVNDGERIVQERDWSKRKGRLLFAMLVIKRGMEVSRESILDHLWPDLDEERGKNNFYVAWSSMKSALMPADERSSNCPYVQSMRGRCRIVPELVRSDIDDFEELVTRARVAEAEDRIEDALDAYAELTSVYRGDLLPGDLFDDWFSPLREKYRTEFVEAMNRATDLMLRKDDPCGGLTYARRGIDIDPSREDLYQAALRCQISAGHRSAAIDTFMQCKSLLSEELGLDPSVDTIALYERVLAMEEGLRCSYGVSDTSPRQ